MKKTTLILSLALASSLNTMNAYAATTNAQTIATELSEDAEQTAAELYSMIEGASAQLTQAINVINNYSEATQETYLAIANGIAQNIAAIQNEFETAMENETIATEAETIANEITGKGGIQEQITQMLNAAAAAEANYAAAAEVYSMIEAASTQLTQAINVISDYSEATQETYLAVANGIAQNIQAIQNEFETAMENETIATEAETIMNEISGKGGIQEQITQMLNAAADAEANYAAAADVYEMIQAASTQLTQAINVISDYSEATQETYLAVANGIAQNIQAIQNEFETAMENETIATEAETIMNEISGKGGIQEQITQMLNAAADAEANYQTAAEVYSMIEGASAQLTQAINVISDYSEATQETYLAIANGIAQNIAAIQNEFETAMENETIAAEAETIMNEISGKGGIQEQITQMLNAAAAAEANYTAAADVYEMIEGASAQLTQAINVINNYSEATQDTYLAIANGIAQNIAAIQNEFESAMENETIATEAETIMNEISGKGGIQEQITQMLNAAADAEANYAAAAEVYSMIEAASTQLTQAINVISSYKESTQEQFLPVANSIAQNIAAIQNEFETAMENGTIAAEAETIANEIFGMGGIQEQITQMLNAAEAHNNEHTTAISKIIANGAKNGKYTIDGQIVIIKNGKAYNMAGQMMK